jgi:hypothetical protein
MTQEALHVYLDASSVLTLHVKRLLCLHVYLDASSVLTLDASSLCLDS